MKALRWFVLAISLTALSFVYSGCSAIMGSLPTVLAYVQDGQLVLSAIESFAAKTAVGRGSWTRIFCPAA